MSNILIFCFCVLFPNELNEYKKGFQAINDAGNCIMCLVGIFIEITKKTECQLRLGQAGRLLVITVMAVKIRLWMTKLTLGECYCMK